MKLNFETSVLYKQEILLDVKLNQSMQNIFIYVFNIDI